jgi:hypothetical protein
MRNGAKWLGQNRFTAGKVAKNREKGIFEPAV